MRDGSNESTPLVHDGIMYLINPRNVVQAIAAASEDLGVRHSYPPDAPNRRIAIYKDTVHVSYDTAVVGRCSHGHAL